MVIDLAFCFAILLARKYQCVHMFFFLFIYFPSSVVFWLTIFSLSVIFLNNELPTIWVGRFVLDNKASGPRPFYVMITSMGEE